MEERVMKIAKATDNGGRKLMNLRKLGRN